MDYNIHKVCRICLEEGALTSIFSTEFSMMPSTMIMMCAKIRVYKSDGLPAVICNNCIYRLGVAYHFKQECENSDIRLRQYLGLGDRGYGFCDAQTNTDETVNRNNTVKSNRFSIEADSEADSEEQSVSVVTKKRRRSRYQRKPTDQYKKRGPKPLDKLPQTCYECQKIFKCAAQLQMHMRTHTGEKPYGCSYCSRRFAQKYNLRIHERTHTGERPFQCEICSKQFSALGNFQAHQKIHTGIKNQLCPVCQKAFYSAGDLSKHMAIHTGLKQHACEICGKAFSRQRDMRAHKRKLHDKLHDEVITHEEAEDDDVTDAEDGIAIQVGGVLNVSDCFKCPDCNKEFPTANSLSVHFRSHASGNILNLPQAQVPPPPPQHHHNPYTVASMHTHPHGIHPHGIHGIHDSLHHHAQQHGHPHHLSTLAQPANANVANVNVGGMQHHHHAAMTHMLPPPLPPPTPTGIMHAQRLHPY